MRSATLVGSHVNSMSVMSWFKTAWAKPGKHVSLRGNRSEGTGQWVLDSHKPGIGLPFFNCKAGHIEEGELGDGMVFGQPDGSRRSIVPHSPGPK